MERVYKIVAVTPSKKYNKFMGKDKRSKNSSSNQNTESFAKILSKTINHNRES